MLAPGGWPYASSAAVDAEDLGRYHALFGRDALITSLQLMPARPDVARASLRALATMQGRVDDPATDEEPGKIPHEYWPRAPEWLIRAGWPVRDGELRYYGSADGTSWFLVVLAALADRALADELEPAWRAAGRWLSGALARGGGLVRHGPRREPGGLAQQGWRDAIDPTAPEGPGIVRPDGSAPAPPLADADTQAVTVAALRGLAALSGDDGYRREAERLRERIGRLFSVETMALERGEVPVPGAGSQLGWLLWADALPPAAASAAADRLTAPDVLTPFGLRTLSAGHPAFRPDAYHRGAVWPFDCWIGWGGLRACGRHDDAERVRTGVLDALDRLGRAPELYAVTASGPERIAIANRVQAWTVGAHWALEAGWDGRSAAVRA